MNIYEVHSKGMTAVAIVTAHNEIEASKIANEKFVKEGVWPSNPNFAYEMDSDMSSPKVIGYIDLEA